MHPTDYGYGYYGGWGYGLGYGYGWGGYYGGYLGGYYGGLGYDPYGYYGGYSSLGYDPYGYGLGYSYYAYWAVQSEPTELPLPADFWDLSTEADVAASDYRIWNELSAGDEEFDVIPLDPIAAPAFASATQIDPLEVELDEAILAAGGTSGTTFASQVADAAQRLTDEIALQREELLAPNPLAPSETLPTDPADERPAEPVPAADSRAVLVGPPDQPAFRGAGLDAVVATNIEEVPAERIASLIADGLATVSTTDHRIVTVVDVLGNELTVFVLQYRFVTTELDVIPYYRLVKTDRVWSVPQLEGWGVDVAGAIERLRSVATANHYADLIRDNGATAAVQGLVGAVVFTYHFIPLGAALDEASQGNYGEAAISLAGDAAFLFTGGLAKIATTARGARNIHIAGAAIEGGIGIARTAQGIFAIRDGKNLAAAGYFGEAALRFLGMSKDAVAALKIRTPVATRFGGAAQLDSAPPPVGSRGIWEIASDLERGALAEARLGGRTGLHFQFPVIDRFENGVAISVKTMDLLRDSYQAAQPIVSRGKRMVNEVAEFATVAPVSRAGVKIKPSDVTQRGLDIVVPPWQTTTQRDALRQVVEFGKSKNITVRIVEMQ